MSNLDRSFIQINDRRPRSLNSDRQQAGVQILPSNFLIKTRNESIRFSQEEEEEAYEFEVCKNVSSRLDMNPYLQDSEQNQQVQGFAEIPSKHQRGKNKFAKLQTRFTGSIRSLKLNNNKKYRTGFNTLQKESDENNSLVLFTKQSSQGSQAKSFKIKVIISMLIFMAGLITFGLFLAFLFKPCIFMQCSSAESAVEKFSIQQNLNSQIKQSQSHEVAAKTAQKPSDPTNIDTFIPQRLSREQFKAKMEMMEKQRTMLQTQTKDNSVSESFVRVAAQSAYVVPAPAAVLAVKEQALVTTPPPPSVSPYYDDIVMDPVYVNAPADIKSTMNQMMQPLAFATFQKARLAYALYTNPNNPMYRKAEKYYYNAKYNFESYNDQIPLCIVAPGRNLVKKNRIGNFIDSIQRQQYSNYKLIYVDDVSTDSTSQTFEKYIKQSNGLLSRTIKSGSTYEGSFIVDLEKNEFNRSLLEDLRTVIIQNTERIYALGNRDRAIRNFCPVDSVVLDVDADDAFIGCYAFKLVNGIYHNPETWMFNSVFIYDRLKPKKYINTGPHAGVRMDLLQSNTYRTSLTWATSELRTFRTKLFLKIDNTDFKNQTSGKYYQWASDVFMQEPLVELSGPKHYKHLYEILYYYDYDDVVNNVYKKKHYRDIAWTQTPYKPLAGLEDAAQKVENYVVPERVRREFETNLIKGRNEAQKYHTQFPF